MGKKDNKSGGGGGSKDAGKGGKGGKGKGGGGDDSGGKQQKGAQSINVRHILNNQCNKMGEAEKAIERLQNGESFNTVAMEMSQDKARSGMFSLLRCPASMITNQAIQEDH
ncbi:uncharacterized protein PODANS_7_10155 [Podospora anserina S mat+]|uniref:Podospora anserina S mat+ genomic DNA chromosome 7, supercontig 1 n=1 Tax=Podospora anserina (strain S / ATCC MYA-4624 / DSM 980 / FGSC 10383) TaxID=515849 RepID=B2AXD1_PODAN|nr:uncharacterized protein PODANS_7_10155 [Podospora anserina S mat+]CAP69055.1 unnamed protein product [Podospora anserina S mat+]CDP32532.1 Putative protein of unknown function [Podospora anserina S mat+]